MKKKSSSLHIDLNAKVFEALESPRWEYRTVNGIAKEVHVDRKKVEEILRNHPEFVRVSIAKAANGSTLFASRKKVSRLRDAWTAFRAINKFRYGS